MSLTSYNYIEIVQDERFGFNGVVIEAILKDWSVVDQSAYVHHHLDNKEDGTRRDPHWHLLIHFNTAQPHSNTVSHIESVCKDNGFTLSLPDQCFQKMRGRGHKGWCACLNYYTHRDEHDDHPWKHIYPVSDIISSYDISADLEVGHDNKAKHKKVESLKITEARKSDVFEAVRLNGLDGLSNFTRFQIRQYASEISAGFDEYLDSIDRAHDTLTIFVSGDSAIGKDNFARYLLHSMGYNGSQIYQTQRGSHPFDGYDLTRHRAVIFSEARDNILTFSDFLSFTEPHRVSVNAARYFNRLVYADVIIITSSRPQSSWYKTVRHDHDHDSEDSWQFFRRIPYHFHLDKDTVTCFEVSKFMFKDKYKDFPYFPFAYTNNRFYPDFHSELPVYNGNVILPIPDFESLLYSLFFVPIMARVGCDSCSEDGFEYLSSRDLHESGIYQIVGPF